MKQQKMQRIRKPVKFFRAICSCYVIKVMRAIYV